MTIPTQRQPLPPTAAELKQERRYPRAELQVGPIGQEPRLTTRMRPLTCRIDLGGDGLEDCPAAADPPPRRLRQWRRRVFVAGLEGRHD